MGSGRNQWGSLGVELGVTLLIVLCAVLLLGVRVMERRSVPTSAGDEVLLDNLRIGQLDLVAAYRMSHLVGSETARIQIIEFGSFTCSFCRQFASTLDTLQRRYPDMIALRWVNYVPDNTNVDDPAFMMALGSECLSTREGFDAYYRAQLLGQRPLLSRDQILEFGVDHGAQDAAQILGCIDGPEARSRLATARALAQRIGISVTPTWLLNGEIVIGAMDTHDTDSLILRELHRIGT